MSPVLRTLVFTILVAGLWTVALPYWLLPPASRPHLAGVGIAGALLVASGSALYVTCAFWGFALRGQGTPAPIDPPKKLVVEGPYRFVRNPMYWSVVSVMLGEAILLRALSLALWAAGFFAGASLFVILYEEPVLRRKFGAAYEEYCRRVPRWLPRWPKSA